MKARIGTLISISLIICMSASGGLPAAALPTVSEGTPVTCVCYHFVFGQDLVLARTEEKLYRATDAGWHELSPPPFYEVRAAPDGAIYIYAGGSKVYRSLDGGETWDLMGEDVPSGDYLSRIFPSPVHDVVFLAVTTSEFEEDVEGIYKSTDGGATWTRVLGIDGARGKWVAFSPDFAIDGTAFAALDAYHTSLGIWKTENWGETWTWMGDGLASGFTFMGHQWVAVSPQYPQDQTAFTADFTGIYKTTDGGQEWFRVASSYVHEFAFSPNYINDQTILATDLQSLVLTQDGGESWQLLFEYYSKGVGIRYVGPFENPPAPPPPGPHRVYLPIVEKSTQAPGLEFWLVRGRPTDNGVDCYLFRSYDLGVTWEEVAVFEPSHWLYLPLVSRAPTGN